MLVYVESPSAAEIHEKINSTYLVEEPSKHDGRDESVEPPRPVGGIVQRPEQDVRAQAGTLDFPRERRVCRDVKKLQIPEPRQQLDNGLHVHHLEEDRAEVGVAS